MILCMREFFPSDTSDSLVLSVYGRIKSRCGRLHLDSGPVPSLWSNVVERTGIDL